MPHVADLVSDLYDFVLKNRRDLNKVGQDVIDRIEGLKKTFDSTVKKYQDAEHMLNELEEILEVSPSSQVFIGLDFTKYEEIINYIQNWYLLLKEPDGSVPDFKCRLDMKTLDIEKDQLEYDCNPDKLEDTKYLGFSSEATHQHVFAHCQKVLDSAAVEIKENVRNFVDYIIRNRMGRLESELQRYIRICETLDQEYLYPKEIGMAEQEYLDSRAPYDRKCQIIRDRILELETEKRSNQLSS